MIIFRRMLHDRDVLGISLSPDELARLKDADTIGLKAEQTGWENVDVVLVIAPDDALAEELERHDIEHKVHHYVVESSGTYGGKQ